MLTVSPSSTILNIKSNLFFNSVLGWVLVSVSAIFYLIYLLKLNPAHILGYTVYIETINLRFLRTWLCTGCHILMQYIAHRVSQFIATYSEQGVPVNCLQKENICFNFVTKVPEWILTKLKGKNYLNPFERIKLVPRIKKLLTLKSMKSNIQRFLILFCWKYYFNCF